MAAWFSPYRLTGIAAPLAVWALHFLAVYIMQGLACAEDWQRAQVAGAERVTWWLLLATALAIAAIAWLGLRAVRRRPPPDEGAEADIRRRRFAAGLTAAVSLLALIAVAFTALPILLLPPCA